MLYKKTMFRAFLHLTKDETDNMSIQAYMDYGIMLVHTLKLMHAPYLQHD